MHTPMKGSIPVYFFMLCILLAGFIFSAGCATETPLATPLPNATPDNNSWEDGDSCNVLILNMMEDIYSINASFPVLCSKTTVYVLKEPEYTEEWLSSLAKKLGMSGKIRESEKAYYADETEEEDYYFVVHKEELLIVFKNYRQQSGDSPSPEDAIRSVKEFLESAGLLFPDATNASVGYNTGGSISPSGESVQTWRQIVVSFDRERNGLNVLGSRIIACIDPQGTVVELFLRWPDYAPYREVSVKSPEQAFAEYLEYQRESLYIQGPPMKPEKVVVTEVLLAYRSVDGYLEPTYIFLGYGQQGEATQPFSPVYIVATNEIPNVLDGN